MSAPITEPAAALKYILAGRATVTLASKRTGNRSTYRLRAPKDGDASKAVRFVSLLSGPDNDADYTYLGTVFGSDLRTTRKSAVSEDAPSFRALAWSLRKLAAGELPAELEVWHEGRCGCCSRRLTTPESISRGLGPKCAAAHG